MPTARNVTALSQMEQSARVGGGCSQVVRSGSAASAGPCSCNAIAERRSRAPAGRASGDGTWLQIAFGAEGHRAAPRGRASAPFVCEQVLELGEVEA